MHNYALKSPPGRTPALKSKVPYSKKLWWGFLIWQFGELGKDCQIKSHQFKLYACVLVALSIWIAQYNTKWELFNAHHNYPLYGMPNSKMCLKGLVVPLYACTHTVSTSSIICVCASIRGHVAQLQMVHTAWRACMHIEYSHSDFN